ncbi:MAG: hypothetical protein FJ390_01025 [Verrucomicrobia bacterium]|nr:hypothetical protein [Verrucomicrobiota bacterium]
MIQKLFSACAAIEKVPEEKLDAVTALSGSGPAFALLFLEGLMEAGIKASLDPKLSRQLAAHTLEAAAALVLETSATPESLRHEITSPQGTTAAGLQVLDQANLNAIVGKAVQAAIQRATQLGR